MHRNLVLLCRHDFKKVSIRQHPCVEHEFHILPCIAFYIICFIFFLIVTKVSIVDHCNYLFEWQTLSPRLSVQTLPAPTKFIIKKTNLFFTKLGVTKRLSLGLRMLSDVVVRLNIRLSDLPRAQSLKLVSLTSAWAIVVCARYLSKWGSSL